MSMTMTIAGLRVKLEVGFSDAASGRVLAERSYRQNLAHQAAESDRQRWIGGMAA